jgi:uncharacterized protein (DUF2235 family)
MVTATNTVEFTSLESGTPFRQSVGLQTQRSFRFTATNPSVDVIRHAVSIDERRAFFRQNLFHRPSP